MYAQFLAILLNAQLTLGLASISEIPVPADLLDDLDFAIQQAKQSLELGTLSKADITDISTALQPLDDWLFGKAA